MAMISHGSHDKSPLAMEKTTGDELKPGMSGSSTDEVVVTGSSVLERIGTPTRTGSEGIEIKKEVETPPNAVGLPSDGSGGMTTTKGYGLKKWRRIKREPVIDGGSGSDCNRILKRGLSIAEPAKSRDASGDNRQKNEGSGSVASAKSQIKNMVFSALPIGVPDSESRLPLPVGTDSENSEDRSSKSTAASAPKLTLEMPLGARSTKEKGKVKNPSGRASASSTHKSLQGKGKVETSKKLRGERLRAEKENSHSSVESDLQSSSAAFTLSSRFPVVGDERQAERLLNYTGENCDEIHLSEPLSSEEVQADYKENGEEVEVISKDAANDLSGEEKKKESQNHSPNRCQDPLMESIDLLQSLQTALEKELKEFGEIGKESVFVLNGSTHGVDASHHVLSGETEEHESLPSEPQLIKLSHRVNYLQRELAATSAALKVKESEVLSLESIINKIRLPGDAEDQTILQEQEVEFDSLFKKRIEAEIENLILTRTAQELKVTAVDQISLFEEQEQMLLKLREAENKAVMLRMQAGELEASCKELLETADILRMQSDVCKSSLCSLIQLVLLCIVFGLFLLQMLPQSTEFVPT